VTDFKLVFKNRWWNGYVS